MSEQAAHRDALPPGTRLREFELLEVLGRGGFGITYRGWYPNLGVNVAIKEYMPSEFAVREPNGDVYPKTRQSEEWYRWGLDKFLEEAKTLLRFNHPSIVRVLQFFQGHRTAYMVMEYLEGQTLFALLHEQKTLSEARLRALIEPILDGLDQVHATGYLHRDIKPGNIVFRDEDTPVLIDFGAAYALTTEHSRTVAAFEMPGFSPIEQYSVTGQNYGPWTDLYAVGAVLYRAMTELVPVGALSRIERDDLPPVGRVAKRKYSKELTGAVDWALKLRAADRPQSIAQWRRILEGRAGLSRLGDGSTVRVPGKLVAALVMAATVVIAGGAWWWLEEPPPASRQHPLTDPPNPVADDAPSTRRAEVRESPGPNPSDASSDDASITPAPKDDGEPAPAPQTEVAQLLAQCQPLKSDRRWDEALACVRQVFAVDLDNAEARTEELHLEMLVAFSRVHDAPSVEGYYRFMKDYPWSPFVDAAADGLKELENSYWEEVKTADTRERYRRYREIYPAGRYVNEAQLRLLGGG